MAATIEDSLGYQTHQAGTSTTVNEVYFSLYLKGGRSISKQEVLEQTSIRHFFLLESYQLLAKIKSCLAERWPVS